MSDKQGDGLRVWIAIPPQRVQAFRTALMKLQQREPDKTQSQVMERAIMDQASALAIQTIVGNVRRGGTDTTGYRAPNAEDDARIIRIIERREAPTAREVYLYINTLPRAYIDDALRRLVDVGAIEPVVSGRTVRYQIKRTL